MEDTTYLINSNPFDLPLELVEQIYFQKDIDDNGK